MSIDNDQPAETDDTNLDDFSAEFFGESKADPDDAKPEEDVDKEDSDDAPPQADEDTQDEDTTDDESSDSDEGETEEEDEPEEAPKPKKKTAQDRISELTAARREAERRADALEARLAALEKPAPKDEEAQATTSTEVAEVSPPKATDLNDDGTEKYPLGEFDPNFITDLADFRVEQRFAERERQEQEKAARAKQDEAMGELEAQWNGQLETARERYPDYNDKIADLQPVFSDVDEHYGDYLSNTLMSMEKGTDILYYLADHPEEARQIVDSGPQKATILLGRLEARFIESEDSAPPRRVSKAPAPPPANKGSSGARTAVAPDTDDLDAFETLFFNKK
jgi:hypothetical protein